MSDLSTVWAALARGEHAAAIAVAERILREQPAHAESLQLLGAARFEQGDAAAAAGVYRRLTALQPGHAAHWVNLGTVLREAGAGAEARASHEEAARLGADDLGFHLNYGLLLWDTGEVDAAHAHLVAAQALAPDDAVVALALGGLCCQTVRQEQALAVLGRWRQWQALSEAQLPELSGWLLQLGEMAEAEAVLRLALSLDPAQALAQVRLAGLLERLNRLEEAEALLARLPPALTPDADFERRAGEARLAQRRGRHAEAVGLYEALLAQPEFAQDTQELEFSRARSLDALGQPAECFVALAAAHAAQMRHLAHHTPRAVAQPEPLRIADYSALATDVARWPARRPDARRPDPVFVVGFPRSGTTLLEQLLDAHPGLCAMDEQPFLQQAISDIEAAGVRYPEALAELDETRCDAVREAYWARVASKVALTPGVRLVDKNPLNLLRLPAIRRLFPDARVLLVVRHPCDVLLSCYMQHFRAPEFAVLCRSLESLAEGYAKAFDFWHAQQALVRAQVLELRYETFVADVPGTARALVDFIGLPWDERLLDPAAQARQRGYISTPSYAQVVKPVHRDAVGRWRRHAQAFAPVLPVLAPHLARWGYEG